MIRQKVRQYKTIMLFHRRLVKFLGHRNRTIVNVHVECMYLNLALAVIVIELVLNHGFVLLKL